MKKNTRHLLFIGFTFILFFFGNFSVKAKSYSCIGEGVCCDGSIKYSVNQITGIPNNAYYKVYIDENNKVICETSEDGKTIMGAGHIAVSCNVDINVLKKAYETNQCDYITMEYNGTSITIESHEELPNTSPGNNVCNEADQIIESYNVAKSNLEKCQKSGGDCSLQISKYSDVLNKVHKSYQAMQNDVNFNSNLECYKNLSAIVNGDSDTPGNSGNQGGLNNSGENCGIITGDLAEWLLDILKLIRYAGPAILVIMTIMDFIKAIASNKDEEIKKSVDRFIKRLIAIVLLFLLPLLIEFILKTFDIVSTDPFCGLM